MPALGEPRLRVGDRSMLMSEKVSDEQNGEENTAGNAVPDHSPEAARRAVLKKLGVYGAFVAPALLTALSSSASAQVVVESGATN
jgi:hypothetical protein